nr:TBC1 domain family member 15 [Mirounga angustirostris]
MAAESVVSGKIIYEQEGVYIHSSCGKTNDQDSLISGILRVLEKDAEVIVDWRPLDDALDSSSILYAGKDSSSVVEWTQAPKERGHRGSEHLNNYEAEWDMVNTVPSKKKPHTNGDAPSHRNGKSKWSFLFSLTDLKSIKQNREGMGWSYLVFCLKDDVVLPALHFHQGDSKLLIDSLEKYVVLCEYLLDVSHGNLISCPQSSYLKQNDVSRVSSCEKDVNRTDRTNKFYEGQDNPGLILLHDILMTYCMYDFDLGYVQGMSDLLSPLLYVMENEVDAFWCFASYMDQMHQNFEEQMQGMKTQLIQLSTLLRLLDSGFCSYLESQDSGYLYFCFRWLLIRFKREFSFLDILRLWEVMWTELPCKNFHLLLCCAILESEKQQIMEKHYGFNEILKHINELSMKIDVEDVLCKAEAISLQMVKCKELPQAVCEILGLQDSEVTTPDSDTGEDENVGMTSCPTSTFQSDSLPVLATSGARDDDPTQISVSPNVSRLTPA